MHIACAKLRMIYRGVISSDVFLTYHVRSLTFNERPPVFRERCFMMQGVVPEDIFLRTCYVRHVMYVCMYVFSVEIRYASEKTLHNVIVV